MPKFSLNVISVKVGEVVITATYPANTNNYWVALIGTSPLAHYEVYKVLQEFTGWDAPQPIKFTDSYIPLEVGKYKLQLRERIPQAHSFAWKTWAEKEIIIDELVSTDPPPEV